MEPPSLTPSPKIDTSRRCVVLPSNSPVLSFWGLFTLPVRRSLQVRQAHLLLLPARSYFLVSLAPSPFLGMDRLHCKLETPAVSFPVQERRGLAPCPFSIIPSPLPDVRTISLASFIPLEGGPPGSRPRPSRLPLFPLLFS